MKMKFCEYINNLLSLKIISKQGLNRKIKRVKFDKTVYAVGNIIFGLSPNTFYILRVEKEGHKPLYKVFGKYIRYEEFVDSYIEKFGMLPLGIDISYDASIGIISLVEAFYPSYYLEKENYHDEKRVDLEYR